MSQQQQEGVSESLNNSLIASGFSTMQQTVDKSLDIVENARSGNRIVFPCKWDKLNRNLLGGLQPGKLYIIAGRPGVGKSAFSNQFLFDTLDMAKVANKKVLALYWTFEMPGYQQLMRVSSNNTSLGLSQLLSVNTALADADFARYSRAVTNYKDYPIYFMDKPRPMPFIKSRVESVSLNDPELTIINIFDHSRLVPGSEDTELKRLINVSQTCMQMQSTSNCINILISQLNRDIEKPERRIEQFQPMLSDLFGSDSLGQDAHVVMMLNRPYDLYDITDSYLDEDPRNLLACHIEKNRDGMLGMIPFDAHLENFRITERIAHQTGIFGQ